MNTARTAETFSGVLDLAVSGFGKPGRYCKPGEFISRLSRETRSDLSKLSAEIANSLRFNELALHESRECSCCSEDEKIKKEFRECVARHGNIL